MTKLPIKETITDRMNVIEPLVAGKKTLDCGIVDSRRQRHETADRLEKLPNLLFQRICEINPDTMGVDIDEQGVQILRDKGFNTKTANVMDMDLGERFETIVAGEIIEHLDNPGQFLCNMRNHLVEGGTLLLTTPNPFYFKQVWKIWKRNRPAVHEEHTMWFDPITLSHLCRLSGLDPYEIYWVQPRKQLIKTWPRLFRNYFSHSFMILARPA